MKTLHRRLYFLPALVVFALMLPAMAFAQEPLEAPDALIARISTEVIDIAQNDSSIQKGDMNQIAKVIEEKVMPYVDFEKTTSLTVGRFWRQATPAQRAELSKLFHDLLFYTYASAISTIKQGSVLQLQPLRARPDATDVIVNTRIRIPRTPEPLTISYRLEKRSDGWKMYDVGVMGIWLVESYRTTFANEIERNGIDGLIKVLREKSQSLKKG